MSLRWAFSTSHPYHGHRLECNNENSCPTTTQMGKNNTTARTKRSANSAPGALRENDSHLHVINDGILHILCKVDVQRVSRALVRDVRARREIVPHQELRLPLPKHNKARLVLEAQLSFDIASFDTVRCAAASPRVSICRSHPLLASGMWLWPYQLSPLTG